MISIAKPIIGEEEKEAVLQVLASGQLAQGKRVAQFEQAFAEWAGRKYAVAVSSGTTALQLAMLAHGIGSGDEVITSSFSFIASANCALYVGARPVFADIEPDTFCISADTIAECITTQTRAINVVHLFGQSCDMEPIRELADRRGIALIEDACQSHGAMQNGVMVGSWGTACYSFYPTKNMTTGEGGMVTTDDPAIADQVRLLREHGMRRRYHHEALGYNMRMTDIQAAIGIAQLAKLDGWNSQRRANAALLDKGLAGIAGIATPKVRAGAKHVFHQYTLRIHAPIDTQIHTPDGAEGGTLRDQIAQYLQKCEIGCGIYYPIAIHQQEIYRKLGFCDHLPATEAATAEVLSLPVHPSLTPHEIDAICQSLGMAAENGFANVALASA
jgi:dTDP-4-amino-4,6-dideoxygalactose transaminase